MRTQIPRVGSRGKTCRVLVSAFLVGLALVGPAYADRSVRCEGRIISIGAYRDQVREKCGEPNYLEEWEERRNAVISEYYDYEQERYILPRFVPDPIRWERWTYNFGSTRLIHYLYFRNGELHHIDTGGKGSD
jgi:hypothetical protein